ncbi:MAG TPA: TIR domain-containing protein [Chthoniobacterales bacterium]|nr:TIR domain-containing protein [Chthoniobacterales bacterium]
MTPQVFISHSSKDKEVADAVCHHLESADIPCWMAPRNIEFGSDWTEAIMRGITACRVFVLVFSENANVSGHVRREVAKAFSLGLQVIPFRIEDTLPQSSLSYFLETVHWLDAVTQPLEKHLNSLTERVKKLLANGDSGANAPPIVLPATAYPGLSVPAKRRGWILGAGLAIAAAAIMTAAWLHIAGDRTTQQKPFSSSLLAEISAKSVAVLPFESISSSKDDGYFADGVQDEILNNLAKIAQLKVISRTSVMQYRADTKRDMRQIAFALGVANVLEGTVRREGNRVRVSAQLVDARSDNAVWADSYDRDITDIFTIQSEVAQTIAGKLSAALSPDEKQRIEQKPTKNMAAYDLYLQAKEKLVNAEIVARGDREKPIRAALSLLQQAIQLDPEFARAYCSMAFAHDALYLRFDPTPERRGLGDEAINNALRLQPDLPEVHLAYANHLYRCYADYDRANAHLEIAKRGIPNNVEAIYLEASMNRRHGQFEKAIQKFNEVIALDPHNPSLISDLAETLSYTRRFAVAGRVWDQLIDLVPDGSTVRVRKEYFTTVLRTGDDTAFRSEIESLAESMPDDKLLRSLFLNLALDHRDWQQANRLLEKMKGEEDSKFAYGESPVPIGCYSILLARLQGEDPNAQPTSAETRQLLRRKVEASPTNAALLSNLAVVDALLGHKEDAISQAKRAAEMLPISRDAMDGPNISINLAIVYAWTNEPDLAFQNLEAMSKVPYGVFCNYLKLGSYFEPLRKDLRYDKLLADLAQH